MNQISLGLCCINTELRKKNIFCSRTCIRKNFTVKKAQELALKNIADISQLIEWNEKNGIRCLRLSSDIFPHFTDSETESYSIEFARESLVKVGELAKKYKHRLLMHPGQYNQVGAKSFDVFKKTIADLQHHSEILDTMGMDDNGVLIVHGGGTYKNKPETIERWIEQFKLLPEAVKRRLVIENCERQYSIEDCLYISEKCNIPVVFDFHHHACYSSIYPRDKKDILDILPLVVATWKNRVPVMHISEQGEGRLGHHSDYIEKIPDELFRYLELNPTLHIDLEVEAKMKEQAILRLYEKYI